MPAAQPGNFPRFDPGTNPDAQLGSRPYAGSQSRYQIVRGQASRRSAMVTAVMPVGIPKLDLAPFGTNTAEPRLGFGPAGEPGDGALRAAVASGEVTGLDLLYHRYRPLAFAVACGLLRDRAAAED